MRRMVGIGISLFTAVGIGHPLDLAILTARISSEKIDFRLDISPQVVLGVMGWSESELSVVRVEARADAIRQSIVESDNIQLNGVQCEWGRTQTLLQASSLELHWKGDCSAPIRSMDWKFRIFHHPKVPSTFQILLRIMNSGNEQVYVLDRNKDGIDVKIQDTLSFGRFIQMGMDHIGATPSQWWDGKLKLPDGVDHILFIVALAIGGGTLWQLIALATGFTLGHSITLLVASLGWVRLPVQVVESIIAFSIAYVATEAFFPKRRYRWMVTTLFGLFHGLGFASALAELHLEGSSFLKAIVGFNLGVEIGQALVLMFVVFGLTSIARSPRLSVYISRTAAGVIFLAGSFWFVERVFG